MCAAVGCPVGPRSTPPRFVGAPNTYGREWSGSDLNRRHGQLPEGYLHAVRAGDAAVFHGATPPDQMTGYAYRFMTQRSPRHASLRGVLT